MKTKQTEEPKEIIFKGIITLEDEGAREWLSRLQTKVDTLNERTKKHTREIKELETQKDENA